MCEIICNDERFCGRKFSWGDKYIYMIEEKHAIR